MLEYGLVVLLIALSGHAFSCLIFSFFPFFEAWNPIFHISIAWFANAKFTNLSIFAWQHHYLPCFYWTCDRWQHLFPSVKWKVKYTRILKTYSPVWWLGRLGKFSTLCVALNHLLFLWIRYGLVYVSWFLLTYGKRCFCLILAIFFGDICRLEQSWARITFLGSTRRCLVVVMR